MPLFNIFKRSKKEAEVKPKGRSLLSRVRGWFTSSELKKTQKKVDELTVENERLLEELRRFQKTVTLMCALTVMSG